MPIRINLPDGRVLNLPDDTPDAEIDALVARETQEASGPATDSPTLAKDDYIGKIASKATGIGAAPDRGELAVRSLSATDEDDPSGKMARGVARGGVTGIGLQSSGAVREAFKAGGRRMYQGALKPSSAITRKMPEAGGLTGPEQLAETGLREGLNVSRGGLRKADDLVSTLDDQITDVIKGSAATIPRQSVMRRLSGPIRQFRDQVAPLSDLKQIGAIGREFKATTPRNIPIQQAQNIKRGTYRAQGKKYGELGGAAVEAEKSLARGLKEEIASAEPAVEPINARLSSILPLKKSLTEAMRRTGNRDTFGVTDVIAAATKPGLLAGTLAMRAPIQSGLARIPYRTGTDVDPEMLAAAIRALMLGGTEGRNGR